MLKKIADGLWCAQHKFRKNGVLVSSRMTVIELPGEKLWIHSPIPVTATMRAQLDAIGCVHTIIIPNKSHQLFLGHFLTHYPYPTIYGPTDTDLSRTGSATCRCLDSTTTENWSPTLSYWVFNGIPKIEESIWFHTISSTLIITDLCQHWSGDMPISAYIYAKLNGVARQLSVPRIVRHMVTDKPAAAASVEQILKLPVARVVLGHNSIIESEAHKQLTKALEVLR